MISINTIFSGFAGSFLMLYLTNVAGMSSAICGMLMLVARVFDGLSDIVFGGIIDHTKSKLGHARPWVIYASIPTSICLALLFAIPQSTGWLPYAYFFIVYLLMSVVFYTATAIAVQTLPLLVTRDQQERVTINVIGMILQVTTTVIVSGQTVKFVEMLGGGAAGWRTMAIIYAVIAMVCCLICGGNAKEIPTEDPAGDEKITIFTLFQGLRTVLKNKYYVLLLIFFVTYSLTTGISSAVGTFYYIYVLGDAALMGTFSLAAMSMLLGVLAAPYFVGKFGIYKSNLFSIIISLVFSIIYIPIAYSQNIPLMLVFTVLKSAPGGIFSATLYALSGDIATYSLLKDKAQVTALVTSTSSVGFKIGSGVGTAIGGFVLTIAGYNPELLVQSAKTIGTLNFFIVVFPVILSIIEAWALYKCNVQKAIEELKNSQTDTLAEK